jgi:hypothetical protein
MLTSSQRRGLKMAARLTCVVALGGALVQVASADAAEPPATGAAGADDESRTGTPDQAAPTVAEALRLTPRSGRCWPSWGPIAPPPVGFAEMSAAARDAWLGGEA